jgi:hypothetical protein
MPSLQLRSIILEARKYGITDEHNNLLDEISVSEESTKF